MLLSSKRGDTDEISIAIRIEAGRECTQKCSIQSIKGYVILFLYRLTLLFDMLIDTIGRRLQRVSPIIHILLASIYKANRINKSNELWRIQKRKAATRPP